MSDYQLKGIDKDFWLQVKIFAVQNGLSLKALILAALQAYMEKNNL